MPNSERVVPIKPCNLFEAGGRVLVARQKAKTLARNCARAVTESLINMTGEGVSASAQVHYPAAPPRIKSSQVTAYMVQSVKPEARGMIQFNNALCCALLERACGGPGSIDDPVELLTLAEGRFGERLVKLTLELISRSLGMDDSMSLMNERDAEASQPLAGNMFLLELKVGTENFSGDVSVWLPEEVMTPTLERKPIDPQQLHEVVAALPIPVTAILSRQQTSLGKILKLKVGDTLPLTLPGTAEFRIGNRMLCMARVVARKGQLALELQDDINGNKETLQ